MTEFKDLTTILGTDVATADSLLLLDATGNVTKRILVSELTATQAEAEAGTVNQRFMTPLTTAQAIAALPNGGAIVSQKAISSDGTIDFEAADLNTTDFDFWEFHLIGVVPSSDQAVLHMLCSTSATFNVASGDYMWQYAGYVVTDTRFSSGVATQTEWILSENVTAGYKIGSDTGEHGVSGVIRVYNLKSASKKTHYVGELFYQDAAGNPATFRCGGNFTTAEANDGIRFQFDAGNLESGSIIAVGYKES